MGDNLAYRILLVDDEPLILRSVRAAIPWKELGIEVAGEARNGEQALKLMREHQPHIILSDIRMPSMDGISLMQQAMQERPDIIFIIVSGYGEFDYAREALRQGAFDYLLKPIDHQELYGIINAALAKLRRDAKQKEEAELLSHSVQTLSMLVRERMYAEIIEGNDSPSIKLGWLEDCELQRSYYMLIIRLDRYETLQDKWSYTDRRLWFFVIRNILEEIAVQHGALSVFQFHNGEWVMLAPRASEGQKLQLGRDIVDSILKCTHLSCSVGISRDYQGMDQLSGCYERTKQTLNRQFVYGEGGIHVEQAELEDGEQDAVYPVELERSLGTAVKTLDRRLLVTLLDDWMREMEARACSKPVVERMTLELIVSLYRQVDHWYSGKRFPLRELMDALRRAGTLAEMNELFREILGGWINRIEQEPSREDSKALVDRAKEYIENYYHKDFGIDEIADYVQLSVSYFCSLFKQETGYTFLEYLTKCRVEKACFMLRNTDVKVYQIAPLIGYQDAKYFTQVFKKQVGMTPSEYRELLGSGA